MSGDTQGGAGRTAGLAPVIPLFGGASTSPPAADEHSEEPAERWHPTWVAPVSASAVATEADAFSSASDQADSEASLDAAERTLMKKLRGRSLSVREARSALRTAEVSDEDAEGLIARFLDLGYLDDEALAEQLIDKAMSRKAQGRQAVAQTLSQRGLPRDVIDIALAALPDDESERALEFARSKASSMDGLDRDVALRRLAGQLARRGYGATALSAARQALDERSSPKSRVRFE
ncbi:regulatory protein RecX [Microbacterium sp.]|uniref:regulatory protein RecX n=1 Tax=Microbacterium sp. TaxID=51671 RepID=UPI003734C3F0